MSEAPTGWLRAVDEALVAAHIGIASGSDDYETARKKLGELIDWHVAVATDPAVNGGWQLVPVEPMTDNELVEIYRALPKNSPIVRDGSTTIRLGRAIEAEVLRRVQEANK